MNRSRESQGDTRTTLRVSLTQPMGASEKTVSTYSTTKALFAGYRTYLSTSEKTGLETGSRGGMSRSWDPRSCLKAQDEAAAQEPCTQMG